jgi:hypothetical protein
LPVKCYEILGVYVKFLISNRNPTAPAQEGLFPVSSSDGLALVLARRFDCAAERNAAAILLSTAFSVVSVSALLAGLSVS